MAATSKKFSIYLLRADTKLDKSSLRINQSTKVEQLPAASGLPFEHQCFAVRNKESRPRWAASLQPHFAVDDLVNQTSSLVLLFEASQRVWALCYGNGFHLVNPGSIEPGFGLRVVANSINPSSIKSADARRPDVVTRTIRTQVSAGSTISDLGVAVDRELVKHLAGVPTMPSSGEEFARRVAGADSLQVNSTWELTELAVHAETLLELFESDQYKQQFGFIDNFRPLAASDPIVPRLWQEVATKIDQRVDTKFALAAPELIDEDRFDHYQVSLRRDKHEFVELRLSEFYDFLASTSTSGTAALDQIHIIAVDGDGSPASTRRKFKKYVAAEVNVDDAMYMLVAGQWFEADALYVNRVNSRIGDLISRSKSHPLPSWPAGHDEGQYNVLAGGTPEWISIDKDLIYHGGPHQKVEFGDLLSSDSSSLVHVKKMSSSATLSHLWAQGAVAAELYKSDAEFRTKVQSKYPSLPSNMSDVRLVYAVANDRSGNLQDELFFFSKVHLLQQLDTLNLIGCPVDVVKIQIL